MFQEMCRLCLSTLSLNPLFNETLESTEFLSIITSLTGLQIKQNDGFPQSMCSNCELILSRTNNLKKITIISEHHLYTMGFQKHNAVPDIKIYEELKCEFKNDGLDSLDRDLDEYLSPKEEKTVNNYNQENNLPKTDSVQPITKQRKKVKDKLLKNNKKESVVIKNNKIKTKVKIGENIKNNKIKSKVKIVENVKNNTNKSCSKKLQTAKDEEFVKAIVEKIKNSEPVVEEKPKKAGKLKKGTGMTKLSKEEKKKQYLKLVKGEFDPNGPVQCNICNKVLAKWNCFISHAQIHLGTKFVCEHCGKKFVTRGHMNRHCRSQHGMEKVSQCQFCDFKAIDATLLKHHTRRQHTGERPYICDYCSASYFARRCLIQHIDSHLTSATVQCEQCSQFFKSTRRLSRHKFIAHTCKLYNYQCPICKQIYRSGKYARIHLKKVHSLSVKDCKIIKIKM